MKTELVFKLERSPDGYGTVFAHNCRVDVKSTKGQIYLDNNSRHPIGSYENLRLEGEVLLADIKVYDKMLPIEERFDYSIVGKVISTNENKECTALEVTGVGALMPNID